MARHSLPIFFALIVMLSLVLSGCPGGGCQNDGQCKPGQSCVKGACIENCARESEWCESTSNCCPGMECKVNACRFPEVFGQGTEGTGELPQENQTPEAGGSNETPNFGLNSTGNSTLNETQNETLNMYPSLSGLVILDLAQGQSSQAGGITFTVSDITQDLVNCSVQNEQARIKAVFGKNESEFLLSPGDSAEFMGVGLTALQVPCAVSENDTFCAFSDSSASLLLQEKKTSETILSKGQKFLLPDGLTIAEVIGIEGLGPMQEHSRLLNISEGESAFFQYPYLDGIGSLNLKLEGVDLLLNTTEPGVPCTVLSSRLRLQLKTTSSPESQAGAAEGENTTFQSHRIIVQEITESVYPSDGKSCLAVNRSALLNISFPRANQNYLVSLRLHGGEGAKDISVDSANPWEENGMRIEVSPSTGGPSGGSNAINLRATYERTMGARLAIGGEASLGAVFASLESTSPHALLTGSSCIFTGSKALVMASDGSLQVKKEVSEGDVISLPTGSVKLASITHSIARTSNSCRVSLERAILAISQINKTTSNSTDGPIEEAGSID